MSDIEISSPLLHKHELEDVEFASKVGKSKKSVGILPGPFTFLFIVLLSVLNVFQFIRTYNNSATVGNTSTTAYLKESSRRCQSEFAGLVDQSIRVDWDQQSVFASSNNSVADAAWDALNHDSGVVAVSKDWAKAKGLQMGSDFPWDESKTIYVVNAYHSLHCLKTIYRSFMEYRDARPQSLAHHHVVHCLDQLRSDVLCVADDTLRVTTSNNSPTTAVGQRRYCRSWEALERWTMDHPGCYRFGNPGVEDAKKTQIPRMRFCPEGSPELQRVREYFGKSDDWVPTDEPIWSWMRGDLEGSQF